jgi:hypothetical protein
MTRRKGGGMSKRAKAIGGGIAAMVAVLVSFTTLFDWFEDKVTEPAKPTATPPPTIDARIVDARLAIRNERLIDYLRDTNQDTTGLTRFQQQEPGLRFAVRVRLKGYQGVDMPLRWQMQDDRAGRRLRNFEHIALSFRPENQDHRRTVPVWIPSPPRPGRYTVRFSLLDRKNEPLDDVTTAPFTVARVPAA